MLATVAANNVVQVTTNPNDGPGFSFAYQVLTNYYDGATVELNDVDYARALASGTIVDPNNAIVPLDVGNNTYQIVPVA